MKKKPSIMLNDEMEEKIFAQGYQAQHDGYRLRDNPHKRFSPEWEEWKSGHECSAKDDPYWKNIKKYQRKATGNEPKTYKGKLAAILRIATWTADTEGEIESEFLNELIAAIQNRLGDTEGTAILEKYGFEWKG